MCLIHKNIIWFSILIWFFFYFCCTRFFFFSVSTLTVSFIHASKLSLKVISRVINVWGCNFQDLIISSKSFLTIMVDTPILMLSIMLMGMHYSFSVMYVHLLWLCPLLSPASSSLIPNCSNYLPTHRHPWDLCDENSFLKREFTTESQMFKNWWTR